MAYDTPQTVSYNFGEIDFADAAEILSIEPPTGAGKGFIMDVHVASSETFNAVTTEAFLQLGTAADPDAYVNMGLDTLADTVGRSCIDADYITRSLPASTPVEVTVVANTGGTPAGKGYITVTVAWDYPIPRHVQ